jgi:hypothetical protein
MTMIYPRSYILFSVILSLLFFLTGKDSAAQSSLNYKWYLNANGGISQLYGDIQQSNNPIGKLSDETEFGFGARLGKYIGPIFSLHLQFYNSTLKGNDIDADRMFNAQLMEYQLGTTINFTNLFFGNKERTVNIYGTTGVGAIFYRSESFVTSTGELLNAYGYHEDADRSEASREMSLSIPAGLGFDFKLADRWYLNLESVMRFTNSDELDARVTGSNYDVCYYTSLGISFNFFGKKAKKIIETPPEIAVDPFADEIIEVIYYFPKSIKSNEEFVLKSTVHKGKINGPGRLIQVLPIGLNVLDTLIAGAKTEVLNYTVYLNWDELPADSVIEISYRVKPDKIYGLFPMVSNLYLQATGKEYKFRTNMAIEQVEEIVTPEEPVVEAVIKDTLVATYDIEYRVQVTAGYKVKIPLETLASKYNLTVDFKEDCLGNWCHYSVGSFQTYDRAKEYRNILIRNNGAKDAFIVAFYKGQRLNALSELKDIAPTTHPIKTVYKEEGYCYRVQILAMLNKSIDPETLREMHNIEEEVNEETYHNWRKYTVGKCTSFSEAKILLKKLKDQGITDSFIATYKNGERVLSK